MRTLASIIVLGLTSGLMYTLLGLGFGLIFFVTGRFHFAFSVYMTLSAYLVSWGSRVEHWNLGLAIVIALLAGVACGVLSEVGVYRVLDRKSGGSGLLGVFIASLGLVIAGTAVIQLVWSKQPSYSFQLVPTHVWHIAGAPVSLLEVVVIAAGLAVALACDTLIGRTSLGRQLRAVESNRDLAQTYGLKVGRLFVIVFIIGSLCSSVVGVLRAAQYAATSSTGSDLALYALLVAFLSQGRRPAWYIAVGVGVGIFEAAFGQLFGAVWQQIAVFIVLFVFIAAMPYRAALVNSWRRVVRQVRPASSIT
jgi:branched-chain amino acid transport system permease protein